MFYFFQSFLFPFIYNLILFNNFLMSVNLDVNKYSEAKKKLPQLQICKYFP